MHELFWKVEIKLIKGIHLLIAWSGIIAIAWLCSSSWCCLCIWSWFLCCLNRLNFGVRVCNILLNFIIIWNKNQVQTSSALAFERVRRSSETTVRLGNGWISEDNSREPGGRFLTFWMLFGSSPVGFVMALDVDSCCWFWSLCKILSYKKSNWLLHYFGCSCRYLAHFAEWGGILPIWWLRICWWWWCPYSFFFLIQYHMIKEKPVAVGLFGEWRLRNEWIPLLLADEAALSPFFWLDIANLA